MFIMMTGHRNGRGGFTLLEILLSIVILAAITTITYMVFNTVVLAWRRGMRLTEDMHHGDFVIEQLVMGLRSAYYPGTKDQGGAYGLWLGNRGGDGETARDTLSWVKLGSSLVGRDCPYLGSPHRVYVSIEEDGARSGAGVAVRSWRVQGRPEDEDWDPMEQAPVLLSRKVTGFNCRVAYETTEEGEVDWLADWDKTNTLPTVAELTLYMAPLEPGREPVMLRRVVNIPVAPLSAPW
jgi:prepilin-type N-terminal cleavage/methylation domain-containing protein